MLGHDLRVALRSLGRAPGFSLVAVLTLALGIGANTAIYSVVDSVLLRRAPLDGFARLAIIWQTDRHTGTTREPASLPDFLDFAARSRSFEAMGALMASDVTLSPPGGDPLRLAALRVSATLLPMLGVRPTVGRLLRPDEAGERPAAVALIGEALWTRVYNRDPSVTGRTLRIDDVPVTVVGVVPERADFGVLQVLSSAAYSRGFADRGERARVQVWLPLPEDPERMPRDSHPLFVVGRLAASHTIASAQEELNAIAADLERTYRSNAGRGVHVEALDGIVFGPVRPAFMLLLGAAGLVLLVACVNVANLLIVRGADRLREVAIRTALGAWRRQLARQLFVESLLLSLAAVIVGLGLAFGGIRALVAFAPPDIPRLEGATLDMRVLGVAVSAGVLVAVVFGLLPWWQAWRADISGMLRMSGGPQVAGGVGRTRLRRMLVVTEAALAVVLVVGAGLLVRSFWELQQVDPGFRASGVLKVEYQLSPIRYPVDFRRWPDLKEFHGFVSAVLQRVSSLPGVETAAMAGDHPLDPGFTNSFVIVGREAEARDWPEISVRRVTPGYFATVGLPLARGRLLADSDTTAAAPVAVINRAAAERFFRAREPLGARIAFWGTPRTIVGVVADEKFQGLTAAAPVAVYLPLAQAPSADGAGVLLVRTSRDPVDFGEPIRRTISGVDPGVAVFGTEPLETTVGRSVSRQRFTMLLLGMFAALALLLAGVGLHGVLSYGVTQRHKEIAIRLALGERPARIRALVIGEGLALAGAGLAIGIAGAMGLSRLLGALLFQVRPGDALTLTGVAACLLLVALVASAAPARRATGIDPSAALRTE